MSNGNSVRTGFLTPKMSLSLRGTKPDVSDNSSHLGEDTSVTTSSHYVTGDDEQSVRDDGLHYVNSSSSCFKSSESQNSRTCSLRKNEIDNLNQQLEVCKKRVECMAKVNSQLRYDLKKTIRKNMLLDECLTCPYIVNKKGELTFPGKKDLDDQFDAIFKEVAKIKEDLKIFEKDELILCKLKKVLNSPLPRCLNNCCRLNVNGKIIVSKKESVCRKMSY